MRNSVDVCVFVWSKVDVMAQPIGESSSCWLKKVGLWSTT